MNSPVCLSCGASILPRMRRRTVAAYPVLTSKSVDYINSVFVSKYSYSVGLEETNFQKETAVPAAAFAGIGQELPGIDNYPEFYGGW